MLHQARHLQQHLPEVDNRPFILQATDEVDLGSEKDEDGLASPAPCARGTEVLVGCASGFGPSTGAALTRHRALSKFTFLIEAPHGVIACMLGQVSQRTPHPPRRCE